MKLNDAIFNWLQIKVVAEERPQDQAAAETLTFFTNILKEDHNIEIEKIDKDETMYQVHFVHEEKAKMIRFDAEAVEFLLVNIENMPKYHLDEEGESL